MNINDLKSASDIAKRSGVKALVYGPPGSGKTPLIKTAPSPVLCAVEHGLLSIRDASDLPCFEAYSVDSIEEFFKWLFGSAEVKNFDTIGIDSISRIAEIYIEYELERNKDGRKAYGEMSRKVMSIAGGLFAMDDMNVYLVAKEITADENGKSVKKPWFPGQDLNSKVPYLYDEILRLDLYRIPGVKRPVKCFRTKEDFGITARDRSGKLDDYEEPNLTNLFEKCLS